MASHDCDLESLPDDCFKCKMRYVRASGGLSVAWQGGSREFFSGPTIKQRQEQKIAECRAQGWEPRLVNPTYDR